MNIEVRNLKKNYGEVEAIRGVSLVVPDGELISFLGPSGCGKTTLLRMIAGLIPISEGQIFFDGKDVTDLPPQKRNAAMVFQNYALFPNLSVVENVEFGLRVRKLQRKTSRQKALAMLERVQLADCADRRVQEISGGQKQRVALARALVTEPDILLFDEPLSNLDQKLRVSMRQAIRDLQREFRITSIYVTHDQEEAMSISDRIAVIHEGTLQQMDTPQNLYFDPANRFVADFIGKSNLMMLPVMNKDGNPVINVLGESIPLSSNMKMKDKVTVLLRPENLFFSEEDGQQGIVNYLEVLGLITRYHVRLFDGKELVIDRMNQSRCLPYGVGDAVAVSFDRNSLRILVD